MLSDISFRSLAIRRASALALATCCLAGCGAAERQTAAAQAANHTFAPEVVVVQLAPPPAAPSPPPDTTTQVLAYADQIRSLQGAELMQEISRLNDPQAPDDQLRLAIALVQTRQLYDLVRAQELLGRVLGNPSPAARPLQPLARLLGTRFSEQRRVEDLLDRQGQQLRDAQRRLDQTNDKLEALKEIERSLTTRPGASAPAAVTRGRNRTATP